eukprot:9020168-Lingulodinium_polyedra.AAC.1
MPGALTVWRDLGVGAPPLPGRGGLRAPTALRNWPSTAVASRWRRPAVGGSHAPAKCKARA